MKHMKTVEVPATTKDVVDRVTCDLCGADIPQVRGLDCRVDEVEVHRKMGYRYYDDSYGLTTSVDMCGKCFNTKLVPWLQSQCAEPRTEEWDW